MQAPPLRREWHRKATVPTAPPSLHGHDLRLATPRKPPDTPATDGPERPGPRGRCPAPPRNAPSRTRPTVHIVDARDVNCGGGARCWGGRDLPDRTRPLLRVAAYSGRHGLMQSRRIRPVNGRCDVLHSGHDGGSLSWVHGTAAPGRPDTGADPQAASGRNVRGRTRPAVGHRPDRRPGLLAPRDPAVGPRRLDDRGRGQPERHLPRRPPRPADAPRRRPPLPPGTRHRRRPPGLLGHLPPRPETRRRPQPQPDLQTPPTPRPRRRQKTRPNPPPARPTPRPPTSPEKQRRRRPSPRTGPGQRATPTSQPRPRQR